MRWKIFLTVAIFILALHTISAGIYVLDEPHTLYNIGDEVNFSFSIESKIPVYGFVDADLFCEDNLKQNVFRSSVNLISNSSKTFNVSFFSDIKGDCYVKISLIDEEENTNNFYITDELDVKVFIDSKVFYPEEILKINGSVEKRNTNDLGYSILVKISDFYEKKYYFEKRDFYIENLFDSNVRAGNYTLSIYFEEKDIFGKIINRANYIDNVKILSKPNSIKIISDEIVKPPINLSSEIRLLDQSGTLMINEDVLVRLIDPQGRIGLERKVKSGDSLVLNFSSDSQRGGWKLKGIYGSLSMEKLIQIEENKEILVDFADNNSKIIIKNIGNVPYEGVFELKLSNGSEDVFDLINLNLSVSESVEEVFEREGIYNLTLGSKTYYNMPITRGGITGAAISEMDLNYPNIFLVIIFILFLLSGFILYTIVRKRNKDKILSGEELIVGDKPSKKEVIKTKSYDENRVKSIATSQINSLHEKSHTKKIYALFFKENLSENLKVILRKYGLQIHKFKDTNFCIFNSTKNPEDNLFKISKVIYDNSENKNILIHSIDFDNNLSILKSFLKIRGVFNLGGGGIYVSDKVYFGLSNKNDFMKVGSLEEHTFWLLKK
jgi:hypothetical protein